MSHVSEHDPEKKWESYCREYSRVNLLISWNSIGVSDLLSNRSVAVYFESCWRFCQGQLLNLRSWLNHLDPVNQFCLLTCWEVTVSHQKMLPQQHLVETFIDHLFLPEVRPPGFQGMSVSNAIEVLAELSFIEVHQMHDLLVFIQTGLHFSRVLLAIIELEKHSCVGFHDSLQLFL